MGKQIKKSLIDKGMTQKEFADQLGVPLLFEEGPGRHDDIFFDEYIQKILDWMNFAGKSVEE